MSPHSIAFIDSRVAGYETLIAGFSADTRWHVLDAQQDGVAQISHLLAGESDLDAIHIISHGAPGMLYLGSTTLTSGNLTDRTPQWAAIGAALRAGGDLLLYGCDVAAGETGAAFVSQMAQLTGADVAASADLTDARRWGGNGALQVASGLMESDSVNVELGASFVANTSPTFVVANGKLVVQDFGGRLIQLSDGKLLVAGGGASWSDLSLVRLNSDGSLDDIFGLRG